jgi:hypothetical protein
MLVLAGKFLSAPFAQDPRIPTLCSALVCLTFCSLCLGTVIAGAPGGINMYQAVTVPGAASAGGFGCAVSACVFQLALVMMHFVPKPGAAAPGFTSAAGAGGAA